MRVMVFGDSVAYGAWDEKGGWTDRLKRQLHEKAMSEMHIVYNLGVSGESTDGLLKRIAPESSHRMKERERTAIIIEAGANDARFVHRKNCRDVPPERFKENLKKLISTARKRSSVVMLVGPYIVDQKRTDPVPWNKDHSFRNADIREYDSVMASVCRKERVRFISLIGVIGPKDLSNDGLHPNGKGHEKIFKAVWRCLAGEGIA